MMQRLDLPLGEAPALILRPIDTFARRLATRTGSAAPAGRLAVRVEGIWPKGAAAPHPIDPPLRPTIHTTSAGLQVMFNEAVGADGVRRRPALQVGCYELAVESDFYQTARLSRVTLPGEAAPIDVPLAPSCAYPFPTGRPVDPSRSFSLLSGVALHPDGRGMEGAIVRCAAEDLAYATDASGSWVIVFAPGWRGEARLTLERPGRAPEALRPVAMEPGARTTLRAPRLRGQVLTSEGYPAPGAWVALAGEEDAGVSADRAGRFTLAFPAGSAQAHAVVLARGADATAARKRASLPQPAGEALILTLTPKPASP